MPGADDTTIRPSARDLAASEPAVRPWLAVLWHPVRERIGDVAALPANLSRLEPDFGAPGDPARTPLGDAHLSRKPTRLVALAGGAIRVEADATVELVVDGVPLAGARELTADAIARGVVLELAGRVVLWLQARRAPAAGSSAELVGASDAIAQLRAEIARVADLAVPVLIAGETGAGKEHVARELHAGSPRPRGPFVAVNMATLASGVAAAQLFGHARGAFTGADRAHAGLFEQADGGTLFLDEIADAPPDVQAMLLRALETGEIQPVGADAPRKVDVRIVAATDADLEDELASGEFRLQLYHRLAGYRIAVPPLRARVDDVGRLLARFVARELEAAGALARLAPGGAGDPPWLPAAAIRAYARHAWPGNVRELANVARHLAIVGRRGPIALADALAPLGAAASEPAASPGGAAISDDDLVAALARHRWKIGATARELAISRSTLYALIDRCARIRKARDLDRDEIAACRDAAAGDLDRMSEQLQVSKRGLQLRMRELGMS